MKRILTLLLVMALTLGVLVGCGSGEERLIGNPSQVRNDTTGKWYKATTSKNISDDDILEYAKEHIEEGQVHYIINFNTNTTVRINYFGDEYFITVTEYEKKEEHDAKTIGGGMILKEYELK